MNAHLRLIVPLACANVAWCQKPVRIQVNDPRPLMKAIVELESALKVPIHYEDPRFEAPADIEDVTEQVQNERQKAARPNVRIWIPKGGSLAFEANVADPAGLSEGLSLAAALRIAHESKDYPGRFSVKRIGDGVVVQPTAIRGPDGSWKTVTPAMDAPIDLAARTRTAADTLSLIAAALTRSTGIETGVGRFPLLAFAHTNVMMGAGGEPASAVLVQLLEKVSSQNSPLPEFGSKYSYRLLFDPGVRRYFLHIGVIPPDSNESKGPREPPAQPPSKGRFLLSGPDDQ